MSDNSKKTPLGRSLNKFAEGKIGDAQQVLGKALPASVVSVNGAIVTVKFEVESLYSLPQMTMPLFGPEYIRYPIQPGCKGLVLSADAYLGGMSGLGGGVAALTTLGNLSALVFFPIGNSSWFSVDSDATVIYGPNGVVIQDQDANAVITLTPSSISATLGDASVTITSSDISMTVGGSSVEMDGVNVNINGVLIINGQPYLMHLHSDVTTGTDPSGPVIP